jgi:hypothetical protein
VWQLTPVILTIQRQRSGGSRLEASKETPTSTNTKLGVVVHTSYPRYARSINRRIAWHKSETLLKRQQK